MSEGRHAGCYSGQVYRGRASGFQAPNRLDFRRIVRIGVVMGWPSRTDARKVELAQIPSPIGLAIGAANPAEIDIAIVAEIIAARHKGSGAVF